MNEVYKLFEEYSQNNKLFCKKAITKIINIIKERYELEQYLEEISIEERNPNYKELGKSCGGYDMYNHTMYIYTRDLKARVKSKLYQYGLVIDPKEYIYFENVYILYVLFHELEHVIQVKQMKESNNVTSDILRITEKIEIYEDDFIENLYKQGLSTEQVRDYFQKRQDIYHANYGDCPMERFADINACIKLKYLVDLNGSLNSISNFLQTLIYFFMIRAYKNRDSSPTLRYITNIGEKSQLNKFDWYDEDKDKCLLNCQTEYAINDRVCYGFPISDEEYQFITDIMDQHDILRKVR